MTIPFRYIASQIGQNTNSLVDQFPQDICFCLDALLYPTSRSQKALALSPAEAEIYASASATSDAVLMFHCLRFALGNDVEIRVRLAMDTSAARSFLSRVGVGRIRHISLRILWIQMKIKE